MNPHTRQTLRWTNSLALALVAMATASVMPCQVNGQEPPPSPIDVLKPLVGTWKVYDEDAAESYASFTWKWRESAGAIEKAMTLLPGNPQFPVTTATQVLTGVIGWNPATERVVGVDVQTLRVGDASIPLIFESEYWAQDGKIRRLYRVSYARDTRGMPLPELGGVTRTYRETFERVDPKTFRWTTHVLNRGEWEPFGPNPSGSLLRRTA